MGPCATPGGRSPVQPRHCAGTHHCQAPLTAHCNTRFCRLYTTSRSLLQSHFYIKVKNSFFFFYCFFSFSWLNDKCWRAKQTILALQTSPQTGQLLSCAQTLAHLLSTDQCEVMAAPACRSTSIHLCWACKSSKER